MLTPHDYQEERIESFLNEPTKAALVADDPGGGKTLVAAEIIVRGKFERVLILGVKDTFDSWNATVQVQSEGALSLRRVDSTKEGKVALADLIAGKPGLYFAGTQFLVRQDWRYDKVFDSDGNPVYELDKFDQPTQKQATERVHLGLYKKMKPLDLFIFDEFHVIQSRTSVGYKTVKTIRTEYKLGLSGTPGGNSFDGLWTPTRWLWPTLIDGSYWRWREQWCAMEDVYLKGGKVTKKVVGELRPGAFVASLPLYFRHEAPPVPAPKIIEVELEPEQREQYDMIEKDYMLWVEQQVLIVDLPVTMKQRLRTATLGTMSLTTEDEIFFDINCHSAKLRALSGLLRFWGDEPVIIGMDSKRFAKVVVAQMQRAGLSVAEWTGDVNSKDRAEVKDAFLAKDLQYIVATIPSMSTGLDGFQRVCKRLVWLSEMEGNPSINEQFVRRLYRPPYNPDFQHVKIVAKNTFDDEAHRLNVMKHASMRRSLKSA